MAQRRMLLVSLYLIHRCITAHCYFADPSNPEIVAIREVQRRVFATKTAEDLEKEAQRTGQIANDLSGVCKERVSEFQPNPNAHDGEFLGAGGFGAVLSVTFNGAPTAVKLVSFDSYLKKIMLKAPVKLADTKYIAGLTASYFEKKRSLVSTAGPNSVI